MAVVHLEKFIFGFLISGFNATAGGEVDRCHRDEFCARIVIIYNGAGATLTSQIPSEAIDANAAIKAFIGDSPVLVPSIVFSSDSAVRDTKRLKDLEKTGAVMVLPASIPSFRKAISKQGRLGGLRAQFLASKQCTAIVKQREDISKYVKIEIIVASHSARGRGKDGKYKGLPVWEKDDQYGTPGDHVALGGPVLTKEDFQPIYDVFPNAVVQALISSCDSANVGETIAPDPVLHPLTASSPCYCFAALVGKDLLGPIRVDSTSKSAVDDSICVFASHLQTHSADGKWQGALNLQELNLSIFDYARTNARHVDERSDRGDSIFGVKPDSLNPFENFAVNSLDNLVASGYRERRPISDGVRVRLDSGSSDAVSKEVKALLVKQETSKNGLTATADRYVHSRRRLQASFFKMRNGARDYIKNCYYDASGLGCQTIYSLIQGARAKGNDSLYTAFEKFEKGIETFADEKAYTFGEEEGVYFKSPLSKSERERFFKALADVKANWKDYRDLGRLLSKEAQEQGKGTPLDNELADFNGQISALHQAFLHAYFPDLVEDVLEKRAQATTDFVNAALTGTGKDEGVEELKGVCDQINCLTDIPVGPAFDRKFILPKLPKTQPRVVEAEGRESSAKAQQIYLLPPERR
jgi:hypothetical protein